MENPLHRKGQTKHVAKKTNPITVKPTRKPHYCGGSIPGIHEKREKENKTLKSKPPFRELNQEHSLLLLAGSCTKARQRKGKKGAKVPREVQAATREQLGSIPVNVRGKRSGNHIQWKVGSPRAGPFVGYGICLAWFGDPEMEKYWVLRGWPGRTSMEIAQDIFFCRGHQRYPQDPLGYSREEVSSGATL